MRPIDLARSAAVSTQHVRNLEAAGALPRAARTPSGYRKYDENHHRALLCFQALAAGHGTPTAHAIMAAVHRDQVADALALIDASHAALHQQRGALDAAAHTLTAVAAHSDDDSRHTGRPLAIGELARRLGVRTSTLRVWEQAGLLNPKRRTGRRHRVYAAADVKDARVVHLLRQGRYLFDQIRPVVEGIRGTGGAQALHAALDERRTTLNRRATAMLEGSSRLHAYLQTPGRAGPQNNAAAARTPGTATNTGA